MPAAAPVIAAVVLSAVGTGIEMNQQKQAAKGAANAAKDEQKRVDEQAALQKKTEQANLNQKQGSANASQAAAIRAMQAAMSANSSSSGTILTGPQGAAPATTTSKTLLGA